MLGYANWYSEQTTREILFFVPCMQVLLIGPVVYFYTKTLLHKQFKFRKVDWLHFFPGIIYTLYSLFIFIMDKFVFEEFYFYADGKDKDMLDWYQWTGLFSMTVYLLLSLRYYLVYQRFIYQNVSFADSILFLWIRNFLLAFLSIIVLRVILFLIHPEWGEFGSQFWYYLSFSAIFFYVSINGYTHSVKNLVLSQANLQDVPIFAQEEMEETPKISAKNNEEIQQWKVQLEALIKEKRLFENPRLTLNDVAQELNTTSKTVSGIVNTGFGMNFNDFVNHYRIEAIKELLKKGEHQRSTLLGIALECGFNSKATFNRAFKKSTTLSPKEFIDQL